MHVLHNVILSRFACAQVTVNNDLQAFTFVANTLPIKQDVSYALRFMAWVSSHMAWAV